MNADRCITAYNEYHGDIPDWLDDRWHNSLTGCMACQELCPANVHNKNNVTTTEAFTEEETLEILGHTAERPYTEATADKLTAIGISWDFLELFPRNLALLLAKEAF